MHTESSEQLFCAGGSKEGVQCDLTSEDGDAPEEQPATSAPAVQSSSILHSLSGAAGAVGSAFGRAAKKVTEWAGGAHEATSPCAKTGIAAVEAGRGEQPSLDAQSKASMEQAAEQARALGAGLDGCSVRFQPKIMQNKLQKMIRQHSTPGGEAKAGRRHSRDGGEAPGSSRKRRTTIPDEPGYPLSDEEEQPRLPGPQPQEASGRRHKAASGGFTASLLCCLPVSLLSLCLLKYPHACTAFSAQSNVVCVQLSWEQLCLLTHSVFWFS